jgi:hypothetical protein
MRTGAVVGHLELFCDTGDVSQKIMKDAKRGSDGTRASFNGSDSNIEWYAPIAVPSQDLVGADDVGACSVFAEE